MKELASEAWSPEHKGAKGEEMTTVGWRKSHSSFVWVVQVSLFVSRKHAADVDEFADNSAHHDRKNPINLAGSS
jgi:hypothetical protein